jgi:hypothetical protein
MILHEFAAHIHQPGGLGYLTVMVPFMPMAKWGRQK